MDEDYRHSMHQGDYLRCFSLAKRAGNLDLWFESKFSCSITIEYLYNFQCHYAKTLENLVEQIVKYSKEIKTHWCGLTPMGAPISGPWGYNNLEAAFAERLYHSIVLTPVINFNGKIIKLNAWPSNVNEEPWVVKRLEAEQLYQFFLLLRKHDSEPWSPDRAIEIRQIIDRSLERVQKLEAYALRVQEERNVAEVRRDQRRIQQEEKQTRNRLFKQLRQYLADDKIEEATQLRQWHQDDPEFVRVSTEIWNAYQRNKAKETNGSSGD